MAVAGPIDANLIAGCRQRQTSTPSLPKCPSLLDPAPF
jgi:hypothetical protein